VPYGIAEDSGIDAALALFVQLCRSAREIEFSPLYVNMQRPEPSSVKSFDDFFQCKINYSASINELVFAKDEMLKSLPVANPDLARVNDQAVMDYLRQYQAETIMAKVSSIIIESLPIGTPSLKSVADQLFMSGKTLQRRLKEQDTAFSALLDDIRLTLANNYLIQEWRSIGEICYLLGFTEPSNFTRWYKSETGFSPVKFRENNR
jgi:AraC-like DNA-binding protein